MVCHRWGCLLRFSIQLTKDSVSKRKCLRSLMTSSAQRKWRHSARCDRASLSSDRAMSLTYLLTWRSVRIERIRTLTATRSGRYCARPGTEPSRLTFIYDKYAPWWRDVISHVTDPWILWPVIVNFGFRYFINFFSLNNTELVSRNLLVCWQRTHPRYFC